MEDFKRRLLIEFKELNQRCTKLSEFIKKSPIYKDMDNQNMFLLKTQLIFMEGYRQCLYERINQVISVEEMAEFDREEN